MLTTKPKWKANVRLLAVGPLDAPPAPLNFRQIDGGMLVQEADVLPDPRGRLEGRHQASRRRISYWPICASPGRSCGM